MPQQQLSAVTYSIIVIYCIVTIDDLIINRSKFVTRGIPFIICYLRIVQVICIIVVIFSSCLNMLLTYIRNLLSPGHYMSNKIAGHVMFLGLQ